MKVRSQSRNVTKVESLWLMREHARTFRVAVRLLYLSAFFERVLLKTGPFSARLPQAGQIRTLSFCTRIRLDQVLGIKYWKPAGVRFDSDGNYGDLSYRHSPNVADVLDVTALPGMLLLKYAVMKRDGYQLQMNDFELECKHIRGLFPSSYQTPS